MNVGNPVDRLKQIDLHVPSDTFLADTLAGLAATPKTLQPKYFYDERGSELFEEITELDEYYVTRTEIGIMQRYQAEMCAEFGQSTTLVELGSGASVKTLYLLREAARRGINLTYVPIDISRDFLFKTAADLSSRFPELNVRAVCAEFLDGVRWVKEHDFCGSEQTVVYFPGSTIGNFEQDEARELLRSINSLLRPGDGFLLGTDLIKDRNVLQKAYDDSAGITAAFNLNVLTRMNRELGANFPVDKYKHVAVFNPDLARMEMHLESQSDHVVELGGRSFSIQAGERLHTECSHKYTPEKVRALAAETGYELRQTWMDDNSYFGVHYMVVPRQDQA